MPSVAAGRLSADERRESVLEAAIAEFAVRGLHGTSTEGVARRAGISHPYLFRLFRTKKDLFLAVVERVFARTLATFEAAAGASSGRAVLPAMGAAYIELLRDRDMLLIQLHAYAACADPDVRTAVRRGYGEIYELVERVSGAGEDDVRRFFATGMLLNVIAAIDLIGVPEEPWAKRLVAPFTEKREGRGGRR